MPALAARPRQLAATPGTAGRSPSSAPPRRRPQARIEALLLQAIAAVASHPGAPDLSRLATVQPGCVWQAGRMALVPRVVR